MEEEPSWAQPPAPAPAAAPAAAPAPGGKQKSSLHRDIKNMSSDSLARNMRIINVLLAILTGLASVIAFIGFNGIPALFMAFYCM